MRLIDSVTKNPWSYDNANLKLQEIRKQARDDLVSRSLSRGVPDGTKTIVEGDNNRWVIDHDAARKRHTGRELRLLTHGRWAAYCAEPRDEKAESEHLVLAHHEATIGVKIAAAESVERSLKEKATSEPFVVTQTVETAPLTAVEIEATLPKVPTKRGRGRPRKDASK